MNTSPSPLGLVSGSINNSVKQNTNKAAEYESTAQLMEGFIPRFKNKRDKQFYREVVDAYLTAATSFAVHGQTRRAKTLQNTP